MAMRRRTVLFLPFIATSARAHSYGLDGLKIGHAWALPTTLTEGQVFMPLLNTTAAVETLVAAYSDICTVIEMRPNNRYDETPLPRFDLEPGKPFAMRPTAKHLRLIGLKKPLVIGDRFQLVLDFLNAGEAEIEVYVETQPGD